MAKLLIGVRLMEKINRPKIVSEIPGPKTKAVIEREKLVTTGVGYNVAFPHAKTKSVRGVVIAFGRKNEGVEFEAMDRKPVNLFFLIAAPEDAIGAHLNVMAKLSYLMRSEKNREKLMKAKYKEDLIEVLDSSD